MSLSMHNAHILMTAGALGIISTFVSKGQRVAGITKESLSLASLAALAAGFYYHVKSGKESGSESVPIMAHDVPPGNPVVLPSDGRPVITNEQPPTNYHQIWPNDNAAWVPGSERSPYALTNTIPFAGAAYMDDSGFSYYPGMDHVYPHVPEDDWDETHPDPPLLD